MVDRSDIITVRLFAGLERQANERRSEYHLSLAVSPTVAALTAHLGLGPGVAGLVLVNGVHARDDQSLSAGDEVSLFPPLGGG